MRHVVSKFSRKNTTCYRILGCFLFLASNSLYSIIFKWQLDTFISYFLKRIVISVSLCERKIWNDEKVKERINWNEKQNTLLQSIVFVTLFSNKNELITTIKIITMSHFQSFHVILVLFKIGFCRKFSQLPRFDQYNIAGKAFSVLNNVKRTRPSEYGVCAALPSVQQLSLVIDLFEGANDIQGVVDLITDFIYPREVGYVGLFAPQTSAVKGTMPNKLAFVVAVIRKHYTVILTSTEQTLTIFRG